MTTSNDHLSLTTKSRVSPLEFRNTDLVSKLLAATPPYLYNMSLLPNTYFFSEMLKSFVKAKADRGDAFHPPIKRPRKRNWTSSRSECYMKSQSEQKCEETKEDNPVDWMIRSNKKTEENPLELTMNRIVNIEPFQSKTESCNTKMEPNTREMFSNMHNNMTQDNTQNLVLPPPPPMWYPPLYSSAPYGIDPLHFFIDLRVSGHIYDRKNHKDMETISTESSTIKDHLPPTDDINFKFDTELNTNSFRQSRNCSAFSVPSFNNNTTVNPINLSEREGKSTKFDVKSMGFDRSINKMGTNYVMSNISNIYRNIHNLKDISTDNEEEVKEAGVKKVNDLRTVIGLELVVDYMKHKPERSNLDNSSTSSDTESTGSPTLEVVDEEN